MKFVLHSHLHLDHSGACGNFPKARHLVQRREIDWAFAADWFMKGGYIMNDLTKPGIKWDVMEDEDQYDVFGDGVVQTYQSPGHTPGHQSIMVRLPKSGPILLAIDAAYTMDHWEEKCLPGALTSAREAAASVRRLRRIAEKEGAMVCARPRPGRLAEVQEGRRRRSTTDRLRSHFARGPVSPPAFDRLRRAGDSLSSA